MAYTGDVTVGGPPDAREITGLTVTKLAVGPMDNNAYLLRCTQTGELVLVTESGWEPLHHYPRGLARMGG